MAMEKFKAPPLPLPTQGYDQQYMVHLVRTLGLYFDKLDSKTPHQADSYRALQFYGGTFSGDVSAGTVTFEQAAGGNLSAQYTTTWTLNTQQVTTGGVEAQEILATEVTAGDVYANEFHGSGRFVEVPYNQFLSVVDQTAAAIDAAYPLQLEVDVFPNGITVDDGSKITFSSPGVYNLTYSVAFKSESNEGEVVDIWVRYNGVDVTNSNSRFFVAARKSMTVPSYLIAVTPIMVQTVAAGDYIEIIWRVSSTLVAIHASPAAVATPGVTPDIPLTPSAIVQVQFISAAHPPVKSVGVLPVFGFGGVGDVTVVTT